jgi:hypothetical protein
MAGKSIKATDRRTQSTANNVLEQVSTGSKEQTILITDIISEGEIEGLVHGDSSVYLNNDPIISLGASPYRSSGPLSISLNATTTATVSTGADGIFKAIKGTDPKFLIVHDLYSGTVTLSGHSVVGGTSNFRVGRAQQYTLTSADPLFNSDMEHSGSDFNPNLSAEHLAEGDALVSITTSSGRTLTGIITGVNSTTEATFIYRGRPVTDNLVDASITISIFLEIASISGNIVTLENNAPVTTSNKAFSITAPISSEEAEKYRSGFVEFAPGTLNQEPLMTLAGSGTTSSVLNVTGASNLEEINSKQTVDTDNISGAAAQEVDKVKLIFSYPSGIYIVSGESGREDSTAAAYLITLNITRKTTGGTTTEAIELQGDRILTANEVTTYNSSVTPEDLTGAGVFTHSGKFKTGVTFEETIDLEPYKPFNDFSIEVKKVVFGNSDNTTNANRMPKSAANLMPVDNRFTGTNTATIKTALGIINERLNLPYTAHANVRFNSKDFSSVPTRTYDCYGLKIAVPSGYRTREQTGGDPVYPAFWDGSFSTTKVYTDNPAWVFYDIVTHDRYGLGEWLSTVDISIYDLYKISRYCDELVPDGQGGFEPRFRANIYLTKAADAYKVLKDMATIFRGILYWSNAELMPISDMPQSPIYTFSTSNVIDGKFHYESTGNNTRVNQVIVTWNNPDSDYKLEPLIVEDRDNIVKTGKIVKDDAVAFGCTSQGQALRYGKWKLWTSVNQTEIVSFQSSLNAGFLSVGDVINIQDSHDYTVMYSGRLRGYDSVDDEKLLLDRTPYDLFNAITDNFSISVIIPKKSFTIDESATILDTRTYSTTVSGLSPLAWFALDDNSGTEITDTSS